MQKIWTEQKLNDLLTTPSERLIEDIKKIEGDIMVLGAAGKTGPTLFLLTRNAISAAGINKKVIAVSRFSDPIATKLLTDNGVEIVSADLLEDNILDTLPDVENVIYMAGKKFGTDGQESLTWAMNAWLPSRVAARFRNCRITVFSTGNVYPQVEVSSGGADEKTPPAPIGEYAMSSLARERMFEYAAKAYGTKIAIYRLNYAVDLRYGILSDIAHNILSNEPISIATPSFNCIWQGDANEIAIRCLLFASSDVFKLNVTGPEAASVKAVAMKIGSLLGKKPVFKSEEGTTGFLSNAGKMFQLFGYPSVSLETLIDWQVQWIKDGGRDLGKRTHFEEKKGSY